MYVCSIQMYIYCIYGTYNNARGFMSTIGIVTLYTIRMQIPKPS